MSKAHSQRGQSLTSGLPSDGVQLLRRRIGTLSAVARELGLTPNAVSMWKTVPAEYVVKVERVSGIPRWLLRPDLFEGMR